LPSVNIEGLKVGYAEKGTGLPVIFIPDLTGSRHWFKYQLSGLSEHYRIVSCDLRQASRRPAYTIELLTKDLESFMNARRIISAVITGHGFGGLIAQHFALTRPQKTTALILSSTFPHLPPLSAQQIMDLLAPGPVAFESPVTAFFRRLFGQRQAGEEAADGPGWLAKQNAGLTRQTLEARIEIVQQFDSTSRLSEITLPTLMVVGSEDQASILAGTQHLYEGIPDASLEVIEGADHFSFYTRHDLYNDVIDDFLASHLAELA
jgi:pimeloyl-ACP methyl ester carboxylesterase